MSLNLSDHFFNPRSVGDAAEPSFTGRAASLRCGATARLSIQIDESHNISQAKFRAAGCDVLVASLSILAERVQGRPTADAAAVGQASDELFGELQAEVSNRQCIQVACDALVNAIRAYSDAARDEWNGDEALICTCFFVTERTIETEIKNRGLTTVAGVTRACSAGGGCGSCHPLIQELLEERSTQEANGVSTVTR
jgi:NifU-like protein